MLKVHKWRQDMMDVPTARILAAEMNKRAERNDPMAQQDYATKEMIYILDAKCKGATIYCVGVSL